MVPVWLVRHPHFYHIEESSESGASAQSCFRLNAARVALASEGHEVSDALSLAEHILQDLALARCRIWR